MSIVTLAVAQSVLARMTFPPGMRVRARSGWFTSVVVDIEWDVPNVNQPEDRTVVGRLCVLPLRADAEFMVHAVTATIAALAVHEIHEWVRLDGVPVVEPHPELGALVTDVRRD